MLPWVLQYASECVCVCVCVCLCVCLGGGRGLIQYVFSGYARKKISREIREKWGYGFKSRLCRSCKICNFFPSYIREFAVWYRQVNCLGVNVPDGNHLSRDRVPLAKHFHTEEITITHTTFVIVVVLQTNYFFNLILTSIYFIDKCMWIGGRTYSIHHANPPVSPLDSWRGAIGCIVRHEANQYLRIILL